MTECTLTYQQLNISPSDIYAQMGYDGTQPDEATQQEVQSVVGEVAGLLQARFCYLVVADKPAFDMGKIIERQLRGSQAYALFVCTSGSQFADYQQRLADGGDMVRVFIADALGSVIAEHCADQMEQHLQQSIQKLGWQHTNRYSPGYCGWHVSQQQLLFPLFGGKTCGVTLTDSSLMLPIKSVSGIIGLGSEVRHMDYSCGLCDMQHCFKRRKAAQKSRQAAR